MLPPIETFFAHGFRSLNLNMRMKLQFRIFFQRNVPSPPAKGERSMNWILCGGLGLGISFP
jgi:hypothetical protein